MNIQNIENTYYFAGIVTMAFMWIIYWLFLRKEK